MARRKNADRSVAYVARRKRVITVRYQTIKKKIVSAGPVYAKLASIIPMRRAEIGITQQDLADALGLSRPAVANIETGRQRIYLHDLFEIAAALKMTPHNLLKRVTP